MRPPARASATVVKGPEGITPMFSTQMTICGTPYSTAHPSALTGICTLASVRVRSGRATVGVDVGAGVGVDVPVLEGVGVTVVVCVAVGSGEGVAVAGGTKPSACTPTTTDVVGYVRPQASPRQATARTMRTRPVASSIRVGMRWSRFLGKCWD
jgi:hypothetical protein